MRAGDGYIGVGHVTVDVLPDGRRRAGGTVTFGALAAQMRGAASAAILTAAAPDDVATLVPDGLRKQVWSHPSPVTTRFANRGTDREREQTIRTVAPPLAPSAVDPSFGVVHLGPVAQEVGPGWLAAAPADAVVVLTPQGLVRAWPDAGGEVRHRLIDAAWLAAVDRPLVVVLGAGELAWVRDLGERAIAAGGVLVVTDGGRPATVRWPEGEAEIAPTPVDLADDTGAGDVFAAVLGLALADGLAPPDAVATGHAAVPALLPRIHEALPTLPA